MTKAPLPELVCDALASAFLAGGAWTRRALLARGEAAVGEKTRWMVFIVESVLARFPRAPRDRFRTLARFVASLAVLSGAQRISPPSVERWPVAELAMGARRWDVPSLSTTGELARWLELSPGESEWFADARGLERLDRPERLRHYRYRWVPKRRGGFRLLEAPKLRTKAMQRRILGELLDRIPPHAAAHGFRKGCSVRSHASHHVGRDSVVRIDLQDFFLSVSAARVSAVFRAAGYPEDVAWALALLCANVGPPVGTAPSLSPYASHAEVAALRRAESMARTRHLPQGAPTSPALANLCAHGLDVRLTALARELDATYTRYADDLVFSGGPELARRASRLETLVAAISLDEGFAVNHRKTRVMRAGVRQLVTGVVVNGRLNVARDVYDRVKATLHNCVRHGPASEDREGRSDFRAHLAGRISHVMSLNPARGEKLRALFERIDWVPSAESTDDLLERNGRT
jgi:RNA-directed DNA polymerase